MCGFTFDFQSTTDQNQRPKHKVVTPLEISGDWYFTKGKLKQKWAKPADTDLRFVERHPRS